MGLPLPGSDELRRIVSRGDLRVVYEFLYERRDEPPTMVEIREHAASQKGEPLSQTDRRLRELRAWFHVPAERVGGRHVYPLLGRVDLAFAPRSGVSSRLRGEVLSSQRCAQCGKTPTEDYVKLEVDHIIPHSWGGTDGIDNLQPLCRDCNHDKQAFYSSLGPYDNQIRAAARHLEPHRRIGELLKAFHAAGVDAPAQIVGVVASMHQYQDDWQKRMRELRELGWEYSTIKRKELGRMMSYYRLTAFTEWPSGNIASEIKRRETARKRRVSDTD